MVAIQEEVPVMPCGLDTFRWSLRNRRPCCRVWGEPVRLDLPRTGKGYKEGAALLGEEVTRLWRLAATASAEGFPAELDDGAVGAEPLVRTPSATPSSRRGRRRSGRPARSGPSTGPRPAG